MKRGHVHKTQFLCKGLNFNKKACTRVYTYVCIGYYNINLFFTIRKYVRKNMSCQLVFYYSKIQFKKNRSCQLVF